MTWLLTTVVCVILVELMSRMPLLADMTAISVIMRKAIYTLKAKSVSDHWKEKVMLAYASSMFLSSLKLAGLFGIVGVVAIFLLYTFEYFGAAIDDFIMSWIGVLYSIVVATIYFKIRKFFV